MALSLSLCLLCLCLSFYQVISFTLPSKVGRLRSVPHKVTTTFITQSHGHQRTSSSSISSLRMAVYSSELGVPAALVEERDACGVGFIASLNNEATHQILQQALWACTCMEHRGASSADNISGDGAGVMTAIPWSLFSSIASPGSVLNKDGSFATAVGMIFLPRNPKLREQAIAKVEEILPQKGFEVKGWREVPVDPSVLGTLSADFVPVIRQFVVQSAAGHQRSSSSEFERNLYDSRRLIQGYFRQVKSKEGYVCSLSGQTIIYKGMLRSCDLPRFYKDLTNPEYVTRFAVYHRRFSTNTVPKWFLAQPMRLLAHNGEINTLLGNINWVKSRQFEVRAHEKEQDKLEHEVKGPLVDVGRSDSANLDSILESFVRSGYQPEEALMALVPEAYENQPSSHRNAQVEAFYQYYEALQEAWDGPALLVFSDGHVVGAALDRNGLRPARFMLTEDDKGRRMVHVMSEVGVTSALKQFLSDDVIASPSSSSSQVKLTDSGRLGPGQMLSVNLAEGKLLLDGDIKPMIASKRPYGKMVEKMVSKLDAKPFRQDISTFIESYLPDAELQSEAKRIDPSSTNPVALVLDNEKLIQTQSVFGWGTEDVEVQISSMAADGVEATYCMGDDAPLAALSSLPHALYDYFKQRFAQVTNPPIDPLREGAVMSLAMFLGPKSNPNLLPGDNTYNHRVKISSPVINSEELDAISAMPGIIMGSLSTLYDIQDALTAGGLEKQLDCLCQAAIAAVRSGVNVLNLSDRPLSSTAHDLSGLTYLPPLLAVGAVHHALIRSGLRPQVSLVVTTGQAWATHHFACLVGYGASAILPYAAYDAVINWHGQKRNQLAMKRGDLPALSVEKALSNFRKSINKGLLKIMSKMGISLLTSYHGAQIFEAIGLGDEVVLKAFEGTSSRVGGLSFDDIAAETVEFSRKTFGTDAFNNMIAKVENSENVDTVGEPKSKKLFNYGFLNYLKSGEYHHNNQPLIKTLHSAIRTENPDLYQLYEESVKSRPPTTLRDTLEFTLDRPSIPLEEVEPVEEVMKRFVTGGMSLGALSREAHETLAIAMNRLGALSNSGEGGEDPKRFKPIDDVDEEGNSPSFPHLKGLKKGDRAGSRVKQVASGRFGVTPDYLMSADQLEIKIAQGAKPGEGGQLPGPKIDAYIASLRKSKPGVTLISPPPHHDIYSIEDLAQLIYDLHYINPRAAVSVKLVSEEGIGTVASGVAKAGADIIQISGHDGGTGASPAASIKHAGSPWELGLVEAHSVLRKNGLRDRVLLRADGGLKSGWDVVMAAAMGAEEYGFGTIALIAEGCIMARICHTNKCPVGVTTQNEALRKRFVGTPEHVVTFFQFVAEEVRHILAKLGYRSLEEIIGRPGLLQPRKSLSLRKVSRLDVSYLLTSLTCMPETGENFCDVDIDRSWLEHKSVETKRKESGVITVDERLLSDALMQKAINEHDKYNRAYHLVNTDRSAFARISGVLTEKYGDNGFEGSLEFDLTGAAGQSFGAFLSRGMDLNLKGYANDYVGKGMAGGVISIRAPEEELIQTKRSLALAGNTLLYGATGGKLFIGGRVGERFAVRNSGGLAVVEGMGDHGCEYMTAGTVVNIGKVGRNFGAGMTGGLAFLVPNKDDKEFPHHISEYINTETVQVVQLEPSHRVARDFLRKLLEEHVQQTQSKRADETLSALKTSTDINILIIVPNSEKNNPLLTKET